MLYVAIESIVEYYVITSLGQAAINAATFVGSRTAGTLDAVCATLGVVLPSFLIISLISFLLKAFHLAKGSGSPGPFLPDERRCQHEKEQ